jgi:hypothetical protein
LRERADGRLGPHPILAWNEVMPTLPFDIDETVLADLDAFIGELEVPAWFVDG